MGEDDGEQGGPPVVHPTDRESLERVCVIELTRASGPGGQHANKRETGVRLRHPPSGVVVTATERRSQHQNLELAFDRMAARLSWLQRPRVPRLPTRPTRASIRRRLTSKRHQAQKKAGRGAGDSGE
jgi:protein subunit release factor A